MSRSKRKHPITGFTTSESDKWWKELASGRLRRRVKLFILRGRYDLAKWLRNEDVTCSFTDPKDGRQIFDPKEHPELMRK